MRLMIILLAMIFAVSCAKNVEPAAPIVDSTVVDAAAAVDVASVATATDVTVTVADDVTQVQ